MGLRESLNSLLPPSLPRAAHSVSDMSQTEPPSFVAATAVLASIAEAYDAWWPSTAASPSTTSVPGLYVLSLGRAEPQTRKASRGPA